MKNKMPLIAAALALATLSGCSATVAQDTTITDLIGREVSVTPGSYKRVVCVGAGALRMYSYIGDVSLLSGVEDIDNDTLTSRPKMFDSVARPYFIANKDVFATLPSCGVGGPNGQTAEAEKILSCNPDIVISEFEDVEKENALQEQLGVPVITLKAGPKGVFDDSFQASMSLLGNLFKKEDKAKTLNAFIDSEKKKISDTAATGDTSKKTYICGLGNWGTTDYLTTAQTYEPFSIANITNVVSGLTMSGIGKIEKEKFAQLAPSMDTMIIDAAAVKNIKPAYKADNTLFANCKAWNNGQVYLQMAYNAYYTNFELALINTWYNAKAVYPTLFANIDMTAKTNEITKAFLGKELASEIFAYPSSFGGYQQISDPAAFFGAQA
jgi:iron complex transport system substrate-binding protein